MFDAGDKVGPVDFFPLSRGKILFDARSDDPAGVPVRAVGSVVFHVLKPVSQSAKSRLDLFQTPLAIAGLG